MDGIPDQNGAESRAAVDRFASTTWGLVWGAMVVYGLVSFFFWVLIDRIASPRAWMPWVVVATQTLLALVFSVVFGWRRRALPRGRSWLPLGVLLAGLAGARAFDFEELWLRTNFALQRQDRDAVVHRVERGDLGGGSGGATDWSGIVPLPEHFEGLSLGGGEVAVAREKQRIVVLFFTFRGTTGEVAGFLHVSDGKPPRESEVGAVFPRRRSLGDGWYYVQGHWLAGPLDESRPPSAAENRSRIPAA